jgi:hypothetical protein
LRLDVFDAAGRLAARLLDEPATPGRRELAWGNASDAGRGLAAGAYFARLTVGDQSTTARVTLVR